MKSITLTCLMDSVVRYICVKLQLLYKWIRFFEQVINDPPMQMNINTLETYDPAYN
jgi:hypothetical protein